MSLPVIKVKSHLSLPPQCPGRTRNNLQLTLGPVEWNPLHSYKPHNDDRHAVTIQWWGEKNDGADLPLSTTRKTSTSYAIRRPHKALQCYLTDMGTMTLSLYDKHGDIIGAAALPGIKRLSEDNPVRETIQIRDAVEGYRLGRLPVSLELVGLRRRARSSSGSSRSRSRSCPRSRSGSKKRASPRAKSSKSGNKKDTKKDQTAPNIKEITASIDRLLERTESVQTQMAHNVASTYNSSSKFAVNFAENTQTIPPRNDVMPDASRNTGAIDIQTVQFQPEENRPKFQIPSNLGQAKNLPEIKLYIPPLPDISDIMQPLHVEKNNDFYSQNKENFHIPSVNYRLNTSDRNVPQLNRQVTASSNSQNYQSKKLSELVLGNQLEDLEVSVDYVPSECGSLLDEEILDQIYRINRPKSKSMEELPPDVSPPKAVDEAVWLKKGESLELEVVELVLPRKKGRPPPSNTLREIDDHYCVELGFNWIEAQDKTSQIESCRFLSNKTRSGKILFKTTRKYKSKIDVSAPVEITIYQRSKYRQKFNKIDTVLIDTSGFTNELDYIEVEIQGYTLRLAVMIIKQGERQATCESSTAGNPENTPRSLNTTGRQMTHQQSVPSVSAGPSTHRLSQEFAPSTGPLQLYSDQALSVQSHSIETSFPISFLLWVKFAESIPDVREGPGQPTQPLPEIRVRSPLLEEQISCRVGERSNNPQFNHLAEWTRPILGSELQLLQSSMFAFECWCATAEQGDKLLGLGRVTTSGLASILTGGYARLCSPKYPLIMGDGKIPLRDISSDQIRGYLSVLLAAGTSVQLDHLKNVRSDLRSEISKQETLQQTIIAESISSEAAEPEFEQLPPPPMTPQPSESQVFQRPVEGLQCLISIEKVTNLSIGRDRLVSVSLETVEGNITTEWSADGVWNFQQACYLEENLPESIMFKLYSCAADIRESTDLKEIQSREFGWIEVEMHTLKCGFPCVNGWYLVRSVSGESIGQIKLGIAPATSPRVFVQPKKSVSLEKKLQCPPEKMSSTSKALQDQLKALEDLVNTVKSKQSTLRSRQNATETVSTQITPALSRLDNEQSKNPDHMLRVAEFQSQQIDISVRKVHLALDQGAKEEASSSEKLSDLDCSDEENFIEPLVLNSAKEISEASKSTSNPLSSTRIDESESSHIDDVSTLGDDDGESDAKIEAIVREFSASMTSVQENIDVSRKLRSELNESMGKNPDQTSIWSASENEDDERSLTTVDGELSKSQNSQAEKITFDTQSVVSIEEVDEIDDLTAPLDIKWLRKSKDFEESPENQQSGRENESDLLNSSTKSSNNSNYYKESSVAKTDSEDFIDSDEEIDPTHLQDTDIEDSIVVKQDENTELSEKTQEEQSNPQVSGEKEDSSDVPRASGMPSIAERAIASAQKEIEALSYERAIDRPPRTMTKPLDSAQTRRLAAIFGIK